MARFAVASTSLRGPFKKLIKKLAVTLRKAVPKRDAKAVKPKGTKRPTARQDPHSLAAEVAKATGGVVVPNKGGYTVTLPHGRRIIVVRVMEQGGERTNYFRVNVAGKTAYSVTGEVSSDAGTTHIPISEGALDQILSIIARIKGGN